MFSNPFMEIEFTGEMIKPLSLLHHRLRLHRLLLISNIITTTRTMATGKRLRFHKISTVCNRGLHKPAENFQIIIDLRLQPTLPEIQINPQQSTSNSNPPELSSFNKDTMEKNELKNQENIEMGIQQTKTWRSN